MDADLTVFGVWETATEPMFKSHQLILSGQIGMHFLMILPEGTENGREHEVSARSFNIVWLSEISIQFQNALKIIGKIVCHLINALLQECGDTVMGGLQIIQHTGELRLSFAAFIQIAHDRV